MVITILFGVVGFGLIVFVHEAGHFLAAKANGIQVEIFSLGWGKKLVGFTRGGTSYQISWFPLGGYCKMKGDEVLREARGADSKEFPNEPGFFYSAPAWRRILVIVAGPLANLVFAVLVLSLLALVGWTTYSPGNRIIMAQEVDVAGMARPTPAEAAGLQTGDRLLAIGFRETVSFQDILEVISQSASRTLPLLFERNGAQHQTSITPALDPDTLSGRIGVYAWVDPVISEVILGSQASVAGFQEGDRMVSVNGEAVSHTLAVVTVLGATAGEVRVSVARRRGGTATIILQAGSASDWTADLGLVFSTPQFRSPLVGPVGAVRIGVQETGRTIAATFRGLGLLFQGANLANAVVGPLRITYYAGAVATRGFERDVATGLTEYFRFLSLISVVLFLMNLLPIPALDGGHVVLYTLELATGRSIKPRIVYRIQTLGFSLLLLLAVLVAVNDIVFFING